MQSAQAPRERSAGPTWIGPLAATVAGLLGLYYFYRGFFTAGLAQGDHGDGRLTQVIAAHWANPFQFSGGLLDLGIFYPFGGGLMYSDSMLSFGILSAPLDWAGLDPTIAFQWSLIATSAIGYAATVLLLRLGPRSPWLVAVPIALIVCFSNGLLVASNHPQLIALTLAPLPVLMWLLSVRAQGRPVKWAGAIAAGATFGLISYTAFYVGWSLTLAAALIALFAWLISGFRRPSLTSIGLTASRGLLAAAGAAPFVGLLIATYLPLMLADQGRSLDEVRLFALAPRDLLGVSPHNVAWAWLLEHVVGPLSDEEFAMAPTPLILLASLLAAAWIVVQVVTGRSRRWRDPWVLAGSALIATGLVFWLLPVQWGDVFPWEVVFAVPGASALRAIGRVELVAGALLSFGLALLITAWTRRGNRSAGRLALVGIVLSLIVLEQFNARVKQEVVIADVQQIRDTPAPPEACTSFVLLPPFYGPRPRDSQTDAAIIAQTHGIPTWNGGSGGAPDGWSLWDMANTDGYLAAIEDYRNRLAIDGACTVIARVGDWRPY